MFMFMKVTIDLELECPNSIRGRELIRKQLIRIGRGYIMIMISIIIFIYSLVIYILSLSS